MKKYVILYIRQYLLCWIIFAVFYAPICHFDIFSFDFGVVITLGALMFAPVNAFYVVVLITTKVAAYLKKIKYLVIECFLYLLLSFLLYNYGSFLCSGDSGIGGFKIISQGKLGYLFSELVIYFVLTLIYLFVFFLRTRNKKDSNS